MQCPTCKTDNCKKISFFYNQNTREANTETATGSKLTSLLRHKSVNQSRHAEKLAPPTEQKYYLPLFLAFMGLTLLISKLNWISISLASIFLIPSYLLFKNRKNHNKSKLPKLLKAWEKQWICMKCGDVYTPED